MGEHRLFRPKVATRAQAPQIRAPLPSSESKDLRRIPCSAGAGGEAPLLQEGGRVRWLSARALPAALGTIARAASKALNPKEPEETRRRGCRHIGTAPATVPFRRRRFAPGGGFTREHQVLGAPAVNCYFRSLRVIMPAAMEPKPIKPRNGSGEAVCGRLPLLAPL